MRRLLLPLLFTLSTSLAFAAPPPPQISYVLDDLNVTASWSRVPGATGYRLYYAPYPFAGVETIGSADMGTQTSISVNLWEGAAYYIAVTSRDASGESGYSNIELFELRPGDIGFSEGASAYSGPPLETRATPSPVTYRQGVPVNLVVARLDAQGGALVGEPGTPLEGVVVTFPAGALNGPTTLSLGYDQGGTLANVPQDERGIVWVLTSSGQTAFNKPVTFEFPFSHPDRLPVPFYIHEDGSLGGVTPLPYNRQTGRAGFVTWHASHYTFTNNNLTAPEPMSIGFIPARDGFRIANSEIKKHTSIGACLGMATFAKWYWEKIGPNLSSYNNNTVESAADGSSIPQQRIMAVRAHNSVTYSFNSASGTAVTTSDGRDFFYQVTTLLNKTRRPVLIGLYGKKASHALLAVGYSDHQLAVYDPNAPGETKAMDFFSTQNKMLYDNWQEFSVLGDSPPPVHEDYSYILDDANAGFHRENETKIEVTSHEDGATVSTETITLEGRVRSGHVLIERLIISVEYPDGSFSDDVSVDIPADRDDFSANLRLKRGANRIRFIPEGYEENARKASIECDPETIDIIWYEDNSVPDNRITIVSSSRTDYQGGEYLEEHVTITTNLSYESSFVYSAANIMLNPDFDFFALGQCWNDETWLTCGLLHTWNYDLQTASQGVFEYFPVKIEYNNVEVADENRDGVLETYTASGKATLDIQCGVSLYAEPVGNSSHQYRIEVSCPNADVHVTRSDGYSYDVIGVIPKSLQMREITIPSCVQTAAVSAAAIEPWMKSPDRTVTLTSQSRVSNCGDNVDSYLQDYSESATLSLTLVPAY